MINPELINKAREMRAQGKTEEQITAALSNAGLTEEEVPQAVAESLKASAPAPAPAESAVSAASAEGAPKKKSWWPFGKR